MGSDGPGRVSCLETKLHSLVELLQLWKRPQGGLFDVTLSGTIGDCVLTENEVFSHSAKEYRNENTKEKPCHGI